MAKEYTPEVLAYLHRLYDPARRRFACRARTPQEVSAWQAEARPALRELIGLTRMEETLAGYQACVELSEPEDLGDYTRQRGSLYSEPHIIIPFWLLKPKGSGPFPLGLFPHGHDELGMDTSVGLAHSEEHRCHIEEEDRDVAVQAVRLGFIAIAPTTRGFGAAQVPDITSRHGDRHCRSQVMHCLLAGRTAIAERVWDLMRLMDWALAQPEVDASEVLMMGNSGGGVCTIYTAACDTRVSVAVPSCSFCTFVGQNGAIHHDDCNIVPGMLEFGEFYDVAGLIAPRHLLIVNGRQDPLFPLSEVDAAVAGVRRIYEAAGVPKRFAHRYGEGGHRFYKELMWPFVLSAFSARSQIQGQQADRAQFAFCSDS